MRRIRPIRCLGDVVAAIAALASAANPVMREEHLGIRSRLWRSPSATCRTVSGAPRVQRKDAVRGPGLAGGAVATDPDPEILAFPTTAPALAGGRIAILLSLRRLDVVPARLAIGLADPGSDRSHPAPVIREEDPPFTTDVRFQDKLREHPHLPAYGFE